MDLTKLIFGALIAEALWETSKLIWQQGKISIDKIGAILLGILIAVLTGLDMFDIVGMPIPIPFVGKVLTGLLLSRGANFMHDIIGSMNNVYSKNKVK
jgi:hypothetical protein